MLVGGKMAVKDSFDDEENSDEVEDEVFIRDGRSGGFKFDEEIGAKRPLMAPRRRVYKAKTELLSRTSSLRYSVIVVSFLAIIGIAVLIKFFPNASMIEALSAFWTPAATSALFGEHTSILPCENFVSKELWHRSFPWIKSEAALAMADLNNDGVDDVILGFATDFDTSLGEDCTEYIPLGATKDICGGGVLAVDGQTGRDIWSHWTKDDVLFVDCSANVNVDETKDCLLSGKSGILLVVDGGTGRLVWSSLNSKMLNLINIYSAQYIPDFDDDGYPDVLITHTSEKTGEVAVIKGSSGELLGMMEAPDKLGIFTAPRLIVRSDGTYYVIFATGSFDTGGSLYAVPLYAIATSQGSKNWANVWESAAGGVSAGIVVVDLNSDNVEDIVLATSDQLIVLNGANHSVLWNVSLPVGQQPVGRSLYKQILVSPTPAYFNDDLVPDLLVTQMVGRSFPTYYYSQTWVANGANGENLLGESIIGSSDTTSSISVSFSGLGNDMFLFWRATCDVDDTQQKLPFAFADDTSLHAMTHTDLCQLRFNTTGEVQLFALNQHIQPPGFLLYSSKAHWDSEHNITLKSSKRKKLLEVPEPIPDTYISPMDFPNSKYQDEDTLPNSDTYPDYDGRNLGSSYVEEDLPVDSKISDEFDGSRNERTTSPLLPISYFPRATTAATLAKPLDKGVDVIFATHWETAYQGVTILTEKEKSCIKNRMAKVSRRSGNDALAKKRATAQCLGSRWTSPSRPIKMSQVTLYRVSFGCDCPTLTDSERCSAPLPMDSQAYPRQAAEVYFKSRAFR